MQLPEIKLSKSKLRKWQMNDLPSLMKYADNANIAKFLRDIFPHPYTKESGEFFLKNVANAEPNIIFAIEMNNEAVGSIGAHPLNDVNRLCADFGYWLSEEHWNKGIITEAIPAVVDFVFKNTNTIRLQAGVFETNAASKRVLEKCGFTLESRMRKAVIKNGDILDELIFVKLKE
jgi:[ribosomal protein S5]-alanine N-acetyltransferase